jgi:hypothetical protein
MPRNFKDISDEAKAGWSDDTLEVYNAAGVAFTAEMNEQNLGANKENLKGLTAEDVSDSIGEVVNAFSIYTVAANPNDQAIAFLLLKSAVNDLKKWHVDYDVDSKIIEGITEWETSLDGQLKSINLD